MTYAHLPKLPGIYRIFDRETGDSYVGKSKNVRSRVAGHFNTRGADSRKMRDAMRAKPREAFGCECLEQCDEPRLDEREWHWITALSPSLNTVSGAHGKSFYEGMSALHCERRTRS